MNKNNEELKGNSCCDKKDDSMIPFLTLVLSSIGNMGHSFSEIELATLKGKVEVLEKIVLGKVE